MTIITCQNQLLVSSSDFPLSSPEYWVTSFADVNSGLNPLYVDVNSGEKVDVAPYLTSGSGVFPTRIVCDTGSSSTSTSGFTDGDLVISFFLLCIMLVLFMGIILDTLIGRKTKWINKY